jgi:glycine/D-amino acid oxidase-like deaminating enzyme
VRGLGEDVWLCEAGMLKVSAAPAQDVVIERAVAAAQELGVPEEAVALSAEEVAERCRSSVFRGGVFFREGGTVQPARLARALRRAALAAGVTLFEHSRVEKLNAGVIQTDKGRVRAQEIVVATNAWAASWRPVRSRLTVFGSYVVLTEPVPELLEEIRWTGGEAIFDGRMFLHYFRTTADGRVLMGSGSFPPSGALASPTAGAGRSTYPPTSCPSSRPFRAHEFTTAPGIPETASVRAGSGGAFLPLWRSGAMTS